MRPSERRKRNILIGSLCGVLCIMAVGYAVFSSQLNIQGTSNISSNWDVEITKIETMEQVGAVNKSEPTHTKDTATFNVGLSKPGDYIVYDITVSNLGSIDAILGNIEVNKGDNPAIKFETSGLRKADTITHGTSKILTVKVSCDKNVTSQPEVTTSDLTVTLDFEQVGVRDIQSDQASVVLTQNVVTSGDGLYVDGDGYIFRGANPDNYITFSGDTWRIMGIDSDGNIKIIKNEGFSKIFDPGYNTSIEGVTSASSTEGTRYSSVSTDYCYKSSESSYYGCNAWGSKTTTLDSNGNNTSKMPWTFVGTLKDLPEKEAYLNTYLNGEYLNNLTEKEHVIPHMFNVGLTYAFSNTIEENINHEKAYKWYGKIGLIMPSEYIKASTDESCTSLNASISSGAPCKNGNYLFNGVYYWTISPYLYSSSSDRVRMVASSGKSDYGDADYGGDGSVRPALYLSSDISLEGSGTRLEPYRIVK